MVQEMRNKVARALRKFARIVTVGKPNVDYVLKEPNNPVTLKLHPECTRSFYREGKKIVAKNRREK